MKKLFAISACALAFAFNGMAADCPCDPCACKDCTCQKQCGEKCGKKCAKKGDAKESCSKCDKKDKGNTESKD